MRYLVDRRPDPSVRSRADMVFRGPRLAVYVDGCFWHGCPEHGTQPKKNAGYWADKIAANRRRDLQVKHDLETAGWHVLRVWEHEEPVEVVDRIAGLIERLKRS